MEGAPPRLVVSDGTTTVLDQSALTVITPSAAYRVNAVTNIADGNGIIATLSTADDAGAVGPPVRLTARQGDDGAVSVEISAAGATSVQVGIAASADERFFGAGERSDAVEHRGREVLNRVADGPWTEKQAAVVRHFVPAAGFSDRADATYFPVPWVLSSAGRGVLVDGHSTSWFRFPPPGAPGTWEIEVEADTVEYTVFTGATPAQALAAYSASIGRQPAAAAPFVYGPWWQPEGDEQTEVEALRGADVAMSVAQTYTHYLPCGADDRNGDKARTKRMHDAGLAVTTYVNPMVCIGYAGVHDPAMAAGALTLDPAGQPYQYHYSTASNFDVNQFDFSAAPGQEAFAGVLAMVLEDGYDGWMEDFGEYTPDDAVSADGTPGPQMHNRYPELYHEAAHTFAESAPRPLARYVRSGWTGSIRYTPIVWGGDPTVRWGFDGLSSQIRAALGMGLSGVSRWGSDIGGFFSTDEGEGPPSAELLNRWIQFGAFSGVMRLQSGVINIGGGEPATVMDPQVLPTWKRYSRLRTMMYPYIAGSSDAYDEHGLPLMRHLVLAEPDDLKALTIDDEYLFGADLLVAPVVGPTGRQGAYLPAGQWYDVWSVLDLADDGGVTLSSGPTTPAGDVTVTAGEDIPLYVRAGAVLPLLPADVDTLADYGGGATVRLADREGQRTLLGFAGPDWSGPLGPGETMSTRNGEGEWRLQLDASRPRTYDLQVIIDAFTPCTLTVDGAEADFVVDNGVLHAVVEAPAHAEIVAGACR